MIQVTKNPVMQKIRRLILPSGLYPIQFIKREELAYPPTVLNSKRREGHGYAGKLPGH